MANDEGYIPLSRKFFDHPFWTQDRVFSYAEAWIDLIKGARYESEPITLLIKSKLIKIERGQIPISLRFLGKSWGWSKNKVDSFIKILVNENMIKIGTAEGTVQTIVTICKYDEYNLLSRNEGQQSGQSRDSSGTVAGQYRDKTNKDNKVNKENNNINTKEKLSKESKKKADEEEKQNKIVAAKAATTARVELFYKSLIPFVGKYDKETIRAFFDYWSELDKNEKYMRYEKQPTWEVAKRLATWSSRNSFNGNKQTRTGVGNSAADKAASRQSLEEQANAILGINQPKNGTGGF